MATTPTYTKHIIHIRAEDTPNVRLALEQEARGETPTGEIITPGIVDWPTYKQRRRGPAPWDTVLQCIGLDGCFYEGPENLMYPPDWLNHSHRIADSLREKTRTPKGMGVDCGRGRADSAWYIVDDFGVIYRESFKTPKQTTIIGNTIALIKRFNIPPEMVCIDVGDGGLVIADVIREQGYDVRVVGFGEHPTLRPKSGMQMVADRIQVKELRSAYMNIRAEMYDRLRNFIDPEATRTVTIKDKEYTISGFGLPAEYTKLRQELALIPLTRTSDGKIFIIPKDKPDKTGRENPLEAKSRDTLIGLIGHSPDEADALVLALHAISTKVRVVMVGAL